MATDWAKLKVVQLKAELKRRGLSQLGLKGELVARLDAADNEESEPQQEEEPEPEPEPEEEPEEEPEAQPEQDEQLDDIAPPTDEPETGPAEDAPEQLERSEPVAVAPEKNESPQEQTSAGLTDERAPTTKDRIATPDAAEALPGDGVDLGAQPPDVDGGAQVTVGDASKRARSPTPDKQVEERVSSSVPPESASSAQKRKQRSASPTPNEEEGSSKRVRTEETTNGEPTRVDTRPDEADAVAVPSAMDAEIAEVEIAEKNVDDHEKRDEPATNNVDMDYERDVPPAIHPATSALYISKLMRPVHFEEMQAHLASLASSNSQEPADDIVVRFYIDQIRTHAFAVFATTSAASRVRTALHDTVWPNESNRKALSVDFVPPEKVNEWIEMEESNGNGRSGTRWEVVYRDGPDGTVEATLESASTSGSKPAPPSSNNNNAATPKFGGDSTNTIPVGPRSHREMINPPTGPRAVRPGTGPGPRPPPSALGGAVERTRARPSIFFQLVSEDIAQRRIDNMRSFYTRDKHRDLGREINRYSFEGGDSFVDRGKEVFEGIRPPHRERAVERERRGGGGGGGGGGGRGGGYGGRPPRRGPPPFRPRSDRYLPGRESGSHNGDDRRFRHDDERPSRYGGDWDRDFRSNRR